MMLIETGMILNRFVPKGERIKLVNTIIDMEDLHDSSYDDVTMMNQKTIQECIRESMTFNDLDEFWFEIIFAIWDESINHEDPDVYMHEFLEYLKKD